MVFDQRGSDPFDTFTPGTVNVLSRAEVSKPRFKSVRSSINQSYKLPSVSIGN